MNSNQLNSCRKTDIEDATLILWIQTKREVQLPCNYNIIIIINCPNAVCGVGGTMGTCNTDCIISIDKYRYSC